MAQIIFKGPNHSYTYAGTTFTKGEAREATEEQVEYLMGTGQFAHVRERTADAPAARGPRRRGGVTIRDDDNNGTPDFPANGFRTKREVQTFARVHLGYEADLHLSLKALNAEAEKAHAEKFLKPAEEVAEERPDDLFDGEEIDTAVGEATGEDAVTDELDD